MNDKQLNLNFGNDLVSWEYNGNKYCIKFEGLEFATVDAVRNSIFIIQSVQSDEDKIQYYSFYGDFLFSYDKRTGDIDWKVNNSIKKINVDNLFQAILYLKYNVIVVLKGLKNIESKLMIYSTEGKLICEKNHPENYYFSYLTFDGDKPAVICEGNGKGKSIDKYGRTTWKFSIDSAGGELRKISLAY